MSPIEFLDRVLFYVLVVQSASCGVVVSLMATLRWFVVYFSREKFYVFECRSEMSMGRSRIRSGFWPFLAGSDVEPDWV